MRWVTALPIVLLATHVQAQEGGFHPDQQKTIIERSDKYTVRLRRDKLNLLLSVNKKGQPPTTLVLPNEMVQVDKVEFVTANKIALLGAVNGDVNAVALVDLDSAKIIDKFYCYAPTLSPDKQFLVYIKFFPAHFVQGVSDVYLLYDLHKSPAENRAAGVPNGDVQNVGRVIYPPESKNQSGDNTDRPESEIHTLESGAFYWAPKEDRLVFVDRFQDRFSLITASFSDSGIANIKQHEIKKTDICLSSDTSQCTFTVTSIQFFNDGHLKLKLRPYNSRSPVKAEVDLNEW
jgi:hypothetical protein